jgi:hypothetical protein
MKITNNIHKNKMQGIKTIFHVQGIIFASKLSTR